MSEQMVLFADEHIEPELVADVPESEIVELLNLRYSLKPVEGFVKVKKLSIFHAPDKELIHEIAWVDVQTINTIYNAPQSNLAWGFGPSDWLKSQPKANFELYDFNDYCWVYEIVMENRANRGKQGGGKVE